MTINLNFIPDTLIELWATQRNVKIDPSSSDIAIAKLDKKGLPSGKLLKRKSAQKLAMFLSFLVTLFQLVHYSIVVTSTIALRGWNFADLHFYCCPPRKDVWFVCIVSPPRNFGMQATMVRAKGVIASLFVLILGFLC